MTEPTTTPATPVLPPGITVEDTKYPGMGRHLTWQEQQTVFGTDEFPVSFMFYKGRTCGWVLTTLHISNASRRQAAGTADRYYCIGLSDKKMYTVGRGPHVEAVVTVYLSKDNVERLGWLVALYKKGLDDALTIRDRISTRRAQGQLYRSQGRASWRW